MNLQTIEDFHGYTLTSAIRDSAFFTLANNGDSVILVHDRKIVASVKWQGDGLVVKTEMQFRIDGQKVAFQQ